MTKKEEKETGKAIQPAVQHGYLSPFEEMERWFEEFMPRGWLSPIFRRGWPTWPEIEPPFGGRMPRVDVIDKAQEIVVRAELPGVTKDGLDVSVSERTLTIHATAQHEKKEEEGQYYRREMSRGEFSRSIGLPCDVNVDKAKATFKDGVLELSLPKVESAKRKAIKVD